MNHQHHYPKTRTFHGESGWTAFLDPTPGSSKRNSGLLPGWNLEVYHCDILRFVETYVDRPRAVEDAEEDARNYMAGRLPAWRSRVEGGLTLEDLDLLGQSDE